MLFSRNLGVSFLLLYKVNSNTWIPDTSTQGWRAGRAYSYMPNTTLVGNAYHYFIQTMPTTPSFRQCFWAGIQVLVFTLLSKINSNTWIPDTSTQGWRAGRAYSYMPNTTLVDNAYHYFIQTMPTTPSFRQCFWAGIQVLVFTLLSKINSNTWIPDISIQGWRAGGATPRS
jgi:diacylglycerol kinase